MISKLRLYSLDSTELTDFLSSFFPEYILINTSTYWEKEFGNPLDMIYIISALIDNNDIYPSINIWVSIDLRNFYKCQRRQL